MMTLQMCRKLHILQLAVGVVPFCFDMSLAQSVASQIPAPELGSQHRGHGVCGHRRASGGKPLQEAGTRQMRQEDKSGPMQESATVIAMNAYQALRREVSRKV